LNGKGDIHQQSTGNQQQQIYPFYVLTSIERKASAIRTLKARALEYCSNQSLLAEELNHLLMVFIKNGYPENTVWRILYQKPREKKNYVIKIYKALCVSFHPRPKKILQNYKEQFGIDCIFKKTQTLEEVLSKKGRQIQKKYTKNTVYRISCAECTKNYVGRTTKALYKRNKEHENWCKLKFKKKLLISTKKNDGIVFHECWGQPWMQSKSDIPSIGQFRKNSAFKGHLHQMEIHGC